nr:U32 family peptidase [Succinivibrionaceae bacterium]
MSDCSTAELLAPARDLETGLDAISAGADAVYIGGPSFGARSSAGNSLEDIEKLAKRAHVFGAKVHVALNTILTDDELREAEKLANDLYEAGADALIIQDMGLLECSLPPIELHASTQQNNSTPEKVKFLQDLGFAQAVLARELSLAEIRKIHAAAPDIRLEAFVHGALCVGVSGRCYLSAALTGRSANRGECAQLCRVRQSLYTEDGTPLAENRYLLSMRDLNQTKNLGEMLDAGIRSFKIEGRLKDRNYVKNITAWYREHLDA